MSTRRARIKAVTALPPRRKNIDNAEKKKETAKTEGTNSPKKQIDSSTGISPKNPLQSPKTKVLNENQNLSDTHVVTSVQVITPVLKSPLATKKPETPLLSSVIINNTRPSSFASPLRREAVEKRTLFSPPPNLVARNPNAGKSIDNSRKDGDSQKGTPKAMDNIDYNVPSVLESITDEAMDGIVPLKPACNGPKPIDQWKSDIISENAEVLFDPIVPLPSPSKVRPKVRPVPRLVPLRRNSIQGSASESEDESRRLLSGGTTPAPPRQRHDSHTSHSTTHTAVNREVSRVRNDSICSSVSQHAHAPPPASPLKEKHISKSRRAEQARRAAALRRRRSPRPDTLTMYDLIFYNPTANPILPDQDELKAKEATAKEAECSNQPEPEVDPDDPEDPPAEAAPVPQIKIGPNGEIILDEQSLVIKQSDSGRKVSSSVVREGAWSGGGGRYSRSARTADWSAEETVRFYRALAAVGSDFSLMTPLFPQRSRRDLKLKFKKEERLNPTQVDKALRSNSTWDIMNLQQEFAEEREEAARIAQKEKERLQRWKETDRNARMTSGKLSKAARAVYAVSAPTKGNSDSLTADDIIERAKQISRRKPRTIKSDKSATKKNNTSEAPKPSNNVIETKQTVPINIMMPNVPSNIEEGSLVVLTVTDPSSPSKKMLQTYISRGPGNLTPVALPPQLLNSVVSYVKKGGTTPRSVISTTSSLRSNTSSPGLTSPASVASSRTEPSPKRIRHSSFTITQL